MCVCVTEPKGSTFGEMVKRYGEFTKLCPGEQPTWSTNLGLWVSYMRARKAGTGQTKPLTAEEISALDEVGFVWVMQAGARSVQQKLGHAESWETRFAQLVKYKEVEGDCAVKKKPYATPQGKLYTWCVNQRKARRNVEAGLRGGGAFQISPEQVQRLEDLGFQWE